VIKRDIGELLGREPFVPFRIKLVNGDAHDITHPPLVAFLEEGLFVLYSSGEWAEFPFERVASLESLVMAPDE
jgi:hypothetical protein